MACQRLWRDDAIEDRGYCGSHGVAVDFSKLPHVNRGDARFVTGHRDVDTSPMGMETCGVKRIPRGCQVQEHR